MIVYREVSTLAADLGIPAKTLYGVSNRLSRHYRQVSIPKQRGGVRVLTVPDEVLKHIQRRIVQVLLVHMPVSPHATAYRYGGSVVRNAAPHTGKRFVLKLDILHFFDSVLYSAVKEAAFPATIFSEPVRILLTMLCYYKDALPQGAPSSPAIANLVLREFDDAVGAWCAGRGIAYTRYCDDLTFSSQQSLDGATEFVKQELRKRGFFLRREKTHLLRDSQRQTVTGLVVNHGVRLPADRRRALRQTLYFCRKFGVESHLAHLGSDKSPEEYLRELMGRTAFWMQAEPNFREAVEAHRWIKGELERRTRERRMLPTEAENR